MITNAYVDVQEDRPPGRWTFSSNTNLIPHTTPPPNPHICDTHHTPDL